ncbi:uncharacterized protein BHQ10_006235 [Talaromyces amestolkiae]|uniref:BTB domain-containing protein n=1 Tax=Talaromyces amestolkiae TaxID=1196081 RepID=A0A364L340_TALAM|nr:uncharacterized protein BHQ10_006235 [Talaromyces amestolkiae]RAO70223.1 hypothetical protein BHQ10_006235 [Talaromyces amestolkiae]
MFALTTPSTTDNQASPTDANLDITQITTIIDRPMIIRGTGVSRAYHAEITGVEAEERIRRHEGRRYQIVRMADGSEFAFPAAPSGYEREDPPPPERAADISFPPALRSPSHFDDSSWIYQPPGQPLNNLSHVFDGASGDTSGLRAMPIYSPAYPVTPVSQQFREYSASDPGAQDDGEWRSVSESRERSESWHESHHTSFEAASSVALADVSSQAQSYHAATNDAPTRSSTRPQSLILTTGDETSLAPVSTLTSTTTGRNVSSPTHLLDMALSGRYSDLKIVLDSASHAFPSSTFNVHRVIISQSPALSAILERVTDTNATICIIAAKSFCLPRSFEFALERHYGLELITKDNVYDFARTAHGEVGHGLTSDMLKRAAIDMVLCYGAAGAFLDQPDVVNAAFNLVLELFDWSSLETALQFGLYPEEFLLIYNSSKSKSNHSKNNSKASNGTNETNETDGNSNSNSNSNEKKRKKRRGLRGNKANRNFVPNNLNSDVVDKWAPRIASAAINFLVQNLPSDYYFDRTGLSKDLQDRIPSRLRKEYSIANRNPMLAGLAFGEHPVPTPEANRISAIILALPFLRFREVIEEMRVRRRLSGDMIKAILQEREMRRVSALRIHAQHADGQGDVENLKELGYREFAVHIQTVEYPFGPDMEVIHHEYTLHREWRGYQPESDLQSVIRKFAE